MPTDPPARRACAPSLPPFPSPLLKTWNQAKTPLANPSRSGGGAPNQARANAIRAQRKGKVSSMSLDSSEEAKLSGPLEQPAGWSYPVFKGPATL
jgi:hypothetical protein